MYMSRTSEFTNTMLRHIFERLLLFVKPSKKLMCPKILFTADLDDLEISYGEQLPYSKYPLAWYDEDANVTAFNANKYDIKSNIFEYKKKQYDDFYDEIFEYDKKFRYVIPLNDIYHELIHGIQFQCGNYTYTDFIEGADDILTYIITSHCNIGYMRESTAIWYIARKVLKMNLLEFYHFVLDCVVNKDFHKKHLLLNKNFINLLSKKYNGNIDSFFKDIKSFGKLKYEEEFLKDMRKINNLMFYRF